jgi:glycosyltransferase involved in cell wall biosynthesis
MISTTFKSASLLITEDSTELSACLDNHDLRRPLRIAMIGVKNIPHPGGIENVVEELGTRLARMGHEVTVYVRPHYTQNIKSEYRGMHLQYFPSIPTKHFDAITHSLLSTLHAMARRNLDVAHVHSIGLSPFALPLRLRGIATVVQSHGLDWQRDKWGFLVKSYLRASDRGAVALPNVTTVVSRKLKRYYETRFHRTVTYIPNGVDSPVRKAPDEIRRLGLRGDDYILFASRLVPEKGLQYLLDAYKMIRNAGKSLVIAGDSNYGDRYAAELKRQANPDILFLGFVRGQLFEELLSSAYLYVLPSEIEGLSTGLLQAMAYGNCVLVSDIEENLEVIGESGVSFRRADVGDLREKLEFLLQRNDLVCEYRTKAQSHVQRHYSWNYVAQEYERLYYRLVPQQA